MPLTGAVASSETVIGMPSHPLPTTVTDGDV